MAMTAEAIIFAINSAIRLGRNTQRAYAKSLTSREIVLPLPKFSGTPNAITAQNFFDSDDEQTGGKQYLDKIERLADIHDRFKNGVGSEVPDIKEIDLYVNYYTRLKTLQDREQAADFQEGLNDNQINIDELVALLSIRQYTHDTAKHTSPLQMVAGTLVKIGIDYFNRIPGALNEESATGKTLKHFLKAFDQLDFADNARLRAQSHTIVPQLFIAAAETVSDLGQQMTNDPKVQAFVQEAGRGIAQDLYRRLDNISDADNQEEAVQWGRFLLRSTVANAGNYVFAAPREMFGTNGAASELIQSTATVLLDAILQDPDQLDIKNGINADTLDRLLQSSFGVLADHPRLLTGRNGFEQIVQGVSQALKHYEFRRPDLFPELVRLVLEQTGENLHMFRQRSGGQPVDGGHPESLLIKALQLILAELSAPVPNGAWRPHLSKAQLLYITEELLEEVVANPDWISQEVNGKPLLAAVVRTTIDGLAQVPADERLSPDTFEWLLQLNLRTVAANHLVLQKIRWSDDDTEEAVLQKALDLVFSFVFDPEQVTAGDRYALLAELLDYILDVVISRHPNKNGLLLVDLILFKDMDYSGGFNEDLADALIEAALDTLATYPELISRQAALGEIVAGIASSLDHSSFRRSDILVELVRLTLENTALNARLIIGAESDEPEFFLTMFVQELLIALSNTEADGSWQPNLTPQEAMIIIDTLVNELIQHPEWVVNGPDGQVIFRAVLQAVREALLHLPPSVQLTTEQIEYLIIMALHAAVTSEAVLDEIPWGTDTEKRTVLERALQLVGSFAFRELHLSGNERFARFAELVEYVLGVILTYHPDEKGLLLTQLILFGTDDVDYASGIDEELLDDLLGSALRVMEQHPDLISGDMALQSIIRDLAAGLSASDFREPGVLPELVRLTLAATAQNTHLVVPAANNEPKYLIAIALQTLLTHASATNDQGDWEPQLTPEDLLLLGENLLEQAVQNPQWVIPVSSQEPTIWEQVLSAVMNALRRLPEGARLQPEVLENILLLSLHTAATSPQLLNKVKWGDENTEKFILQRVLDLVVSYVYPDGSPASSDRLAYFLELLEFVMETIVENYPDKRALLLTHLIVFDSDVNLKQPFDEELASDLIDAALDVMHTHPDLLTQDEIFQKIVADTAKAMRASKVPLEHLLPEILRLLLLYSAGHLDRLMKISPNSPRMLLIVALEQVLRVVTQSPGRGRWRPQLTEEQLLDIIEIVLERVVARPEWVSSDKLIQVTLEALYSAMGELRSGQSLPYETVSLLIEEGLDAVGQRRVLVLEVIGTDGNRQEVVLEYALGSLFVELYDTQSGTSAAWTLTEAENLRELLSAYLLALTVGDCDQAAADVLLEKVKEAINQINDNAAFALEDLLEEL